MGWVFRILFAALFLSHITCRILLANIGAAGSPEYHPGYPEHVGIFRGRPNYAYGGGGRLLMANVFLG
ncbi:unnamed protein product, partial [Mesorhabditis spiculigera]